MSFTVPFGWGQDSDKLYVHTSNVRIQRMTYRSQDSWVLIPRGKEDPVLQFPPTLEGRDMAFTAFATGAFPLNTGKHPIGVGSEPDVDRKLGDG